MASCLENELADFADALPGSGAIDPKDYSPLCLAYIGDAVYELMIRSLVMEKGNCSVNKMHKMTSSLVMASAQSALVRIIKEDLTPEEHAVYKRGRNAKSGSIAKHMSMSDYRRATGFEALVGYLYLQKQYGLLSGLIGKGLAGMHDENDEPERNDSHAV